MMNESDAISSEHDTNLGERLEPVDDWIHLQPSIDEERKGRIYLPANVDGSRLIRAFVLAAGDQVVDLHPADVVMALAAKTIELRDGTMLVKREYIVARMI